MNSSMLFIVCVLAIFIWLFVSNCSESFYIEPNTIMGGAMPETSIELGSDNEYHEYSAPLELEGPGDAAWSGY